MDVPPESTSLPEPRPWFSTRRRLLRWSAFFIALVPIWLVTSFFVARGLTKRSRPRFDEPIPQVSWASFEAHRLPTIDGHDLGAWYTEGPADGPSVVLLHGNGGRRADNLTRAKFLASEGGSVLAISFRAHGDSTGDFNDIGYSARHDVVAAVEFLEKKRPGRPVVILGSSLGAAAAIFASEELGTRVSGYILEAPYLDLKTAVRNRTRNALPPGLEWLAYQGLLTVSPLVLDDIDAISPQKAILGIPETVPALLLVGRHDRKATPEQVTALFERIRPHARLVIFEKAGHLHYDETDPVLYRESILGFVKEVGSSVRGRPNFERLRKVTAEPTSSKRSQ